MFVRQTINMVSLLFFAAICTAQIHIEYLNDVPAEFKERYYSKKRNYNPLQVGDMWQYYFSDYTYPFHLTTKIVKDSTINGKQYFKKMYYDTDPPSRNFISWERNDTTSGVSFMLDFEDVNENGDYSEELPLDSLENPFWSRYTTYKYSFAHPNPASFFKGEKSVLVKDTCWVVIEGDTVIRRYFEIGELFWGEEIIETFGIFSFNLESPSRYCTGAIINGREYGTIVSDMEEITDTPLADKFSLGLNYPNPFNPTTRIEYSIPKEGHVILKVYDSLGKEITTLVNERKLPGTYRSDFEAGQTAHG